MFMKREYKCVYKLLYVLQIVYTQFLYTFYYKAMKIFHTLKKD